VEVFLDRYPHPWGQAALPGLKAAVAQSRPVLEAGPVALSHGDAHLDNWMFSPAPVLIDWETARVGPMPGSRTRSSDGRAASARSPQQRPPRGAGWW
jgi:hypothetical protein